MLAEGRRSWVWTGAAVAALAAARVYATRRYYKTTPGPTLFLHEDIRTAWTPAWHEIRAGLQWLRLQRTPVYRGEGVPRGDGSPVLLAQGFLTRPVYLETLRGWLERMGYRARIVDLGWNVDCYDVLADEVAAATERLNGEARRRVHLLGHSLGGILVRAVAARIPRAVASVTTLATPFRGFRVHPNLRVSNLAARTAVRVRRRQSIFPDCMTLACQCASVRALSAPLPTTLPQLAVVPRQDGLVDVRYEADPATTRVVHVPGSHFGIVFEPAAYEALARHLAEATMREAAAAV